MFVSGSCNGLNNCNGHGKCSKNSSCECYPGWGAATDVTLYRAPDCSARTCPSGKAWGDKASSSDTAHAIIECSNRGVCDRKTGKCKCMGNYAGTACERIKCPNDCSGHGRCLKMKDIARATTSFPLETTSYHYEVDQVCICYQGYPLLLYVFTLYVFTECIHICIYCIVYILGRRVMSICISLY
jgi:hypothetical protein